MQLYISSHANVIAVRLFIITKHDVAQNANQISNQKDQLLWSNCTVHADNTLGLSRRLSFCCSGVGCQIACTLIVICGVRGEQCSVNAAKASGMSQR